MTEEENRAYCIREWSTIRQDKSVSAVGTLMRLRAEAFELGRKDSTAEWIEGAAALRGTCEDLSIKCSNLVAEAARQQQIALCSELELRALKAKLARVEAAARLVSIEAEWPDDPDDKHTSAVISRETLDALDVALEDKP